MFVLIPAYEPSEKLLTLVSQIREHTDYQILIVDDGSSERYQPIFSAADKLGCTVLHHSKNEGKGCALKTGLGFLLRHDVRENIVCADADGQHALQDIRKIADATDARKHEMVLGVRTFTGKVPLKSRAGNLISAFLFRLSTGMQVADTQTGLRGYPYAMLPWLLSVEGFRFEYEFNLLLLARKAGITLTQVPISTIYENNNRSTHFRMIADSFLVYLPLLKYSCSSLVSAFLDFTLLFLFQGMTGSLLLGVALARLISSLFNYSVNKLLIFESKASPHTQTAPRYFSLVLAVLCLNYLLIRFFSQTLMMPLLVSKLSAELLLFLLSYFVQQKLIFRRRAEMC